MKNLKRYLSDHISRDIEKKMVFVGGPRQVGKTTMALKLLGKNTSGYLNWDIAEHREKILEGELPDQKFLVFDEIHKYHGWRNYLKGLFDLYKQDRKLLVTGSARLDFYRYGGDSLQGRYYYLRLHPLSFAELKMKSAKDLDDLLRLGGFPEPFFSSSETDSKRWRRDYRTRFIQEDLKSLETIQDIGNLELLMIKLPELVGSPLSINALREDLQVSHKTVANWLAILERLYAIFRLLPFSQAKIRAVKKEPKHYHYDWMAVQDMSLRFENLVACHLLKWVHFLQDTEGRDIELQYFRDIDAREVDFIVVEDKQPVLAVECKWSDQNISGSLSYFKKKFPKCESWQISTTGKKDYLSKDDIHVAPAGKLLAKLV